jgi:hypothetical protein
MTRAAQKVLDTFETLPEKDKKEIAVEILRRASAESYGDLDDSALVLAADQVFLDLDRREIHLSKVDRASSPSLVSHL